MAKSLLAQLKWWSNEEFRGWEKKLKKLVKELQSAKQNNVQYEEAMKLGKLKTKFTTCCLMRRFTRSTELELIG